MLVIEYRKGKAAVVKFRRDWDRTKVGTGYVPPMQKLAVFRDSYVLQTTLLNEKWDDTYSNLGPRITW